MGTIGPEGDLFSLRAGPAWEGATCFDSTRSALLRRIAYEAGMYTVRRLSGCLSDLRPLPPGGILPKGETSAYGAAGRLGGGRDALALEDDPQAFPAVRGPADVPASSPPASCWQICVRSIPIGPSLSGISGFGGLARSGRLPDASPRCLSCRAVRRWKPPAPYCHRRPPRRGDGSSLPCRWGWGRPWLCSPDARRATPAPVGLRGLRRCCGAGAMWFSTAADSPVAAARSTMRGCLRHRPKSGGGTSNAGGIWAAQS